MIHVTCRLTAKNRDQLRNPTLGNRVWATFTFFTQKSGVCDNAPEGSVLLVLEIPEFHFNRVSDRRKEVPMPKRARFVQPFRQNSEEIGQPLSAREYPISYSRIESYRMVVSGGGCPRGVQMSGHGAWKRALHAVSVGGADGRVDCQLAGSSEARTALTDVCVYPRTARLATL